MKMALLYGSAMASFCVERFGPERLMNLSQEAIKERIQLFLDLVSVEKEL